MQTDFLFANPDFLSGLATALDLGGTLVNYNVSQNEVEADLRALASDWAITNKDIQNSVKSFEKKNSAEKPK